MSRSGALPARLEPGSLTSGFPPDEAIARDDLRREGTIRRLLRLYRAPQWLHILPLPLATFDFDAPLDVAVLAAARGVANAFAILAFGFLLNAVSDRHVDRDPRKNPLLVPGTRYRGSLVVLPAISLSLALFSPLPAQAATLWCLLLGCLYSVGPRLKAVPVAGTLINAAGFTPMLFLGMASESLPPRFAYLAIAFAALLLQNQLLHEAGDRIDDDASGIRTTWLTLGPRWTALLAALAGTAAAAAAAFALPRYTGAVAVITATFALAFPLLLARPALPASSAARLRVVHRWCSVVCGAVLYLALRLGS